MADSSSSLSTAISLLVRARELEPRAWEQLVDLYGPLVLRWCRSAQIDAHDSADILQEVFAALATRLSSFDPSGANGNFRGWLWMVTRHKLIDHFRQRQREFLASGGSSAKARLENVADPIPESLMQETDPTNATDLRELRLRAVAQVEAEFELNTWKAFWRSVIDGLPSDIVAKELGTTSANVRQARSRVLRRLRLQLGEF